VNRTLTSLVGQDSPVLGQWLLAVNFESRLSWGFVLTIKKEEETCNL